MDLIIKGDQLSLSGVAVSSKEGETLNSRLKSEFNSKRFEIAAGYEFVNKNRYPISQ